MEENIQKLIDQAPELIATYGLKILLAFVVFWVGKLIAKSIANLISKAMNAKGVDPTVSNFVKSICYYAMFTMVILVQQA